MEVKQIEKTGEVIRFSNEENGKEVGHVYVYIIKNDLHDSGYAYIEDLFVEESARGKGIGSELVKNVIDFAKKHGCYKIVATSREERSHVHKMYEKFGLQKTGFSFRMNLEN